MAIHREVKEAMFRLNNVVNRSRYRGVQDDGPMTDSYHWPLDGREYEAITKAALLLVLAVEKHDTKFED